jgi:hypothetical protein
MISVTSGDDYLGVRRLLVTVTDEAGALVDLTGTDSTFMVKRHQTDADADALITKTLGSGIAYAPDQATTGKGKAFIEIEAADTDALAGRFYYELEAEDSVGIITLAAGYFIVKSDLIRGA